MNDKEKIAKLKAKCTMLESDNNMLRNMLKERDKMHLGEIKLKNEEIKKLKEELESLKFEQGRLF